MKSKLDTTQSPGALCAAPLFVLFGALRLVPFGTPSELATPCLTQRLSFIGRLNHKVNWRCLGHNEYQNARGSGVLNPAFST